MRTIVDLPEEQIAALAKIGERENLSRAELLRRAVADYVKHHGSGPKTIAFGIWRHRQQDGLDVQEQLRAEWHS